MAYAPPTAEKRDELLLLGYSPEQVQKMFSYVDYVSRYERARTGDEIIDDLVRRYREGSPAKFGVMTANEMRRLEGLPPFDT